MPCLHMVSYLSCETGSSEQALAPLREPDTCETWTTTKLKWLPLVSDLYNSYICWTSNLSAISVWQRIVDRSLKSTGFWSFSGCHVVLLVERTFKKSLRSALISLLSLGSATTNRRRFLKFPDTHYNFQSWSRRCSRRCWSFLLGCLKSWRLLRNSPQSRLSDGLLPGPGTSFDYFSTRWTFFGQATVNFVFSVVLNSVKFTLLF